MAKNGYTQKSPFTGELTHYDSHGKKTGSSRPNWGGGYTNYDAKGHKVGESKRNWADGYDHYDAKGHKMGESKRNWADGYDHYDAKGHKTGTSYQDFAGGYDNYDQDGCYIATCVYGSYDCPEVWTLRRFRDDILGRSVWGRLFIRTYYVLGPRAVKWFGNSDRFRCICRNRLDRMVGSLRRNGVAATPYQDKNWRQHKRTWQERPVRPGKPRGN